MVSFFVRKADSTSLDGIMERKNLILEEAMERNNLLNERFNDEVQAELIASIKHMILNAIDDCGAYIKFKGSANNKAYSIYKSETDYFKLKIEDNSGSLYDFAEDALEVLSYNVPYSCKFRFDDLSKKIVKIIDLSENEQPGSEGIFGGQIIEYKQMESMANQEYTISTFMQNMDTIDHFGLVDFGDGSLVEYNG